MSELRDKIIKTLDTILRNIAEAESQNRGWSAKTYRELILSIPGIAIVDREAELPDNVAWHRVEREFEAYCAGRNDMLGAGWVKEMK